MPMPAVWEIFATNLKFACLAYNFRVHAFVLMQNHFHLLATAPEANFSKGVGTLLEMTSRHIGHDLGRLNQKFARRFRRSQISSLQYFFNAYKYVYLNPVSAGLVDRPEEYEFSTLGSLIGKSKFLIPVEDLTFMSDPEGTLKWLNEPMKPEYRDAVRKALRRRVFKYPSTKERRPHPLENERL